MPTTPKRAYSVNEFCRLYSVSRPTAYRLMQSGRLQYREPMGRRLIPVEAAEAWFNSGDSSPVYRAPARAA